jgi:hypothetical protein
MKNRILGLVLVTIGCIAVWLFLTFDPIIKDLNKADFFSGFAIGFGVIALATLVVMLMKKAREKKLA